MKGRHMRRIKPTIGQIVLLFLWVLFFVLTRILSTLPKYDQLVFVLKHLSYFTFYGLTLMISVSVFYRILKKEFSKRVFSYKYLNIMTLLVLIIGLVMITKERINYIEEFETPVLVDCVYYDDLGNMIFDAKDSNSVCPSFEVIFESDNLIELRSELEISGDMWLDYDLKIEAPVTIYETIDLKMTYEDDLLKTYQQNISTTAIIYDVQTRYERHSNELYVENNYLEDHFYSVQKHAYQKQIFDALPEDVFTHSVFEEEEYLYNKYDSIRVNNEGLEQIVISGSREFKVASQTTYNDEIKIVNVSPIYIEKSDDLEHYQYMIDAYPSDEINDYGSFIFKDDELLVTKENPRGSGPFETTYHKIGEYWLLEEHTSYERDGINRIYKNTVDYYKTVLSNELKGISNLYNRTFLFVEETDFGVGIRFYEDEYSRVNRLQDSTYIFLGQRFIDMAYFDYYNLFNTYNEAYYLMYQQNPLLLRYKN